MKKQTIIFFILFSLLFLFFCLNLIYGSVEISYQQVFKIVFFGSSNNEIYDKIIVNNRLPQSLTAILAGGALSVSGLILQTFFRNPLADPSVLGISSGASLGVAILLFFPGLLYFIFNSTGIVIQNLTIIFASILGAGAVLLILFALSRYIKNNSMLLVSGIMISAFASSFIGVMKIFSRSESVHSFAIWGLGSFSSVSISQLKIFVPLILLGLILSFFLSKTLNILLLGEKTAYNLGLNIRIAKISIISVVGFLTAVITAFCGPIAFLGIAIPHITRLIFKTSNHKILIPYVILIGSVVALICNLISKLPSFDEALPVSSITSLFGAPIVVWIILKNKQKND